MFGPLIHGILGEGMPYKVAQPPKDGLEAWAKAIANSSPTLVGEMLQYNPESPLARVLREGALEKMRIELPQDLSQTRHRVDKH